MEDSSDPPPPQPSKPSPRPDGFRKSLHFLKLGPTTLLPLCLLFFDRAVIDDLQLQRLLALLRRRLLPPDLLSAHLHPDAVAAHSPALFCDESFRFLYHFQPTAPPFSVLRLSPAPSAPDLAPWTLVLHFFSSHSPLWAALRLDAIDQQPIAQFFHHGPAPQGGAVEAQATTKRSAKGAGAAQKGARKKATRKRAGGAVKSKNIQPMPKKSRITTTSSTTMSTISTISTSTSTSTTMKTQGILQSFFSISKS